MSIVDDYMNGKIIAYKRDDVHADSLYAAAGPILSMADDDIPDVDVFLWRYLTTVSPGWKPQNQNYGTCVGQAAKLAQDVTAAVTSILYPHLYKWQGRFSVAATYAGGRVEIARQSGRWEGSSCSWSAEFSKQYGGLLLNQLNLSEDDLTNDEALAIKWTASRDGIPSNFEQLCKQNPFSNCKPIRSTQEADYYLKRACPLIQGSTLIPTGVRNKYGISPLRRAGGHATAFLGRKVDIDAYLYCNSWRLSGWGTGPKFPDDMPDCSVWITRNDMAAIIDQRDTYAIIGLRDIST